MPFHLSRGFSLQKGLLFLLALTLFALPLSSTAKSICLALSVVTILLIPAYRSDLVALLQKGWVKAAFFLFAVVFLACLWSPASYAQRLLVLEKYSKLLYLPLLVLGFRDEKTRGISLHAFLAAMLLTSSLAVLKSAGFLSSMAINPDFVFRNHIMTGYMLDFAAYASALFAYQRSGFKRLAYALLFCLFSYHVLFVNGGRMGYIVYFLSLFLLIVQLFPWRRAVVALAIVCSAAVLIYSQSLFMQERVQLLKTQYEGYQHHEADNSVGFRLQFHHYAHSLFNRHPFFGNGTASFLYYFKAENPVPGWGHGLLEPHSQYWLMASEFGLLGVLTLLALFFSLLKACWPLVNTRPLALALLLSFILGNLSDSLLFYSGSGYFFILLMAFCLGDDSERYP